MKILNEPLPGVLELRPTTIGDSRGWFREAFSETRLNDLGVDGDFVQDNESWSARRGTIRGMHLQLAPHAQGKLVRVLQGSIFDVALDLRPESKTRFRHACVELDADEGRQLWIPPGFAHGFCTLVDDTTVAYKVTGSYAPDAERTIRFDDPAMAIQWPVSVGEAVLSDKDAAAPALAAVVLEIDK